MCKLCEIKPIYEFTNKRKLCARCFIRYFQKKILYTIRKFNMINKNDIIGYEKSEDFRSVVLEDILKLFAKKWMIEVVKISSSKTRKSPDKIAISLTIDLEAHKIINTLIKENVNNVKGITPIDKKIIKPLYLFLDKEILLYAKLRKLKFVKEKQTQDKIEKFVNMLEKTHPEVKRAIVNSYLEL